MPALKKLLIIGFVWPEPNSTAAGTRMIQLLDLFQTEGYKITFASTASFGEYSFDLQNIGIQTQSIKLNCSSFDSFIKELNPSIVLFDRFMVEEQFGWRVAENCPDALRIIDTEDLHFLRLARQEAIKKGKNIDFKAIDNDISKREIASIYRSDLSLIISDFEIELLKNQFQMSPSIIHYIPFLLDPISKAKANEWLDFEQRRDFVSIGNFLHEPNWDSILYLKQEIWPLIRKQLPSANLHVYGAYASQKVNQLNDAKQGFLIKGRADDAKAVIQQARVLLAPLRFGAGLKGKLLESMQYGTPSVTTSIGAEGMHGVMPWNGDIANNPADFADAAVLLHNDKSHWQKSQKNGVDIINNFFQKVIPGQNLLNRIADIQNNINEHRSDNFIGSMLLHHTLSSTKYMSKWIESKNKLSQ